MDVALVCLPFAAVERPSVALGLLQAILGEAGIRCGSVYENLAFAERVGAGAYAFASEALGEVVFSEAAFPGHRPPGLGSWARGLFGRQAELARTCGVGTSDAVGFMDDWGIHLTGVEVEWWGGASSCRHPLPESGR